MLTHRWTGASSLPSKTWWEKVASKLHRDLVSSRLFSYVYICPFSLIRKALFFHALGSGKNHGTEHLGMQAKGEIPGKTTLPRPLNSQRRSFATGQTWNLKEAQLLRAQAASGGHCIPPERDYGDIKTSPKGPHEFYFVGGGNSKQVIMGWE